MVDWLGRAGHEVKVLTSTYAQHYFPDLVRAAVGDDPGIGASFWFRKKR